MTAPDRQKLIDRLKKEESYSEESFWDRKQYTWGYGTPAPGPRKRTTPQQAETELAKYVDIVIVEYSQFFHGCKIDPIRAEAICDMIYNLGMPTFKKFKNTVADIKSGEWQEAAKNAASSLWSRQVGARAQRIIQEISTGEYA